MKPLALFALCLPVLAADWTLYRMGPFEVLTQGDKKHARDVLNHLEQLRWTFGQLTGTQEPKTPWPVRVLITRGATPAGFRAVNDGLTGVLAEKAPVPMEWNAELLKMFLASGLGRMPANIERGLVSTLMTAEVAGVHVITGLAPPQPDLDWAAMHMLITNEDTRGRVRILISNLEKGIEPEVAFRNSLGKTLPEMDAAAKAHLAASTVPTADISGKPLNATRDFEPRSADDGLAARWSAETSAADTAMGMVEAAKQNSGAARTLLEAAMKKKPEWPQPYILLSEIEPDPGRKAGLLKRAAELSPRDAALWSRFAELMMEYRRYADADKAWASAERAAATPEEKAKMRAMRSQLVDQRAEADADAKHEAQVARERDTQRVKNELLSRIQEAEKKANAGRELPPGTKVEEWWDDPKPDAKLAGMLRRVDCLGKQLRLIVDVNGKVTQILVKDPSKLAMEKGSEAVGASRLACGAQSPRKVEVEYFAKPDPKLNTIGEAAILRFP